MLEHVAVFVRRKQRRAAHPGAAAVAGAGVGGGGEESLRLRRSSSGAQLQHGPAVARGAEDDDANGVPDFHRAENAVSFSSAIGFRGLGGVEAPSSAPGQVQDDLRLRHLAHGSLEGGADGVRAQRGPAGASEASIVRIRRVPERLGVRTEQKTPAGRFRSRVRDDFYS